MFKNSFFKTAYGINTRSHQSLFRVRDDRDPCIHTYICQRITVFVVNSYRKILPPLSNTKSMSLTKPAPVIITIRRASSSDYIVKKTPLSYLPLRFDRIFAIGPTFGLVYAGWIRIPFRRNSPIYIRPCFPCTLILTFSNGTAARIP